MQRGRGGEAGRGELQRRRGGEAGRGELQRKRGGGGWEDRDPGTLEGDGP